MNRFKRLLSGLAIVASLSAAHGGTPGRTYYVDATNGSDSNNGLDAAHAWQTLTKVRASQFNPGDVIQLACGQTFAVGFRFDANNRGTGAQRPIVVQGCPGDRPTISSGSANDGLDMNNGAGFVIRDMIFVGQATAYEGILAWNRTATILPYIYITDVDVSGYGQSGLWVGNDNSPSGLGGFDNIVLTNSAFHDNTESLLAAGGGSAGVQISANSAYGSGATTPKNTHVLIDHVVAYNNLGFPGDTNWTGSGIVVGECGTCTIQFSEAYNNGGNSNNSSGPVGIWAFDGTNDTIQFNESYNNHTAAGSDGAGFDFDGGVHNSLMQYNYSHGNDGAGFQFYSYNDGRVTNWDNNIIRFNISQNDATTAPHHTNFYALNNAGAGNMTNVFLYNNVSYTNLAAGSAYRIGGTMTGWASNNIAYSENGATLLNTNTNLASFPWQGNDYYATGTFAINWNGGNYGSLAAFQSATGQEKVSGSAVGSQANPLLANPGGGGTTHGYAPASLTAYQLQGASPMIGGGQNLSTLHGVDLLTAKDFFGNAAIGQSGYDVGAHSR